MNIGETIAEHPKTTAAIVIVGVLVLYLLFAGGGTQATSGSDMTSTEVQAATDAYTAQLQAQTQTAQYGAALQSQQEGDAAQLAQTQVAAQVTSEANNLQAGVDMATINAQEQDTALQYTLGAQVQEAGLAAQTQQDQIAANTTIQTTQTVANALVQQSQQQANVAMAGIQAQQAVATQ